MTNSSAVLASAYSVKSSLTNDLLRLIDTALKQSSDLVPLTDARYLEAHGIFEGRSNQQQLILEWFGNQIAPTLPQEGVCRVLSVGCGSGVLDVQIATRLVEQTKDLLYVGVDPNKIECETFQRNFTQASLDSVKFEVEPTTFDQFEAECSFDLINLVHSLYYMPDPAAALQKARKLLAPGGRLVVFHAPCDEMNSLTEPFWQKLYGRSTLFAEDFRRLFDAWHWNYERARVDAKLEVSPLTHANQEVGIALTDFIAQIDSTRLDKPVQDLIARYLDLVSVEDENETHISHPVDVFVIVE